VMAVALVSRLRSLDLYREVPKELTEPTPAGAVSTVIALLAAAVLAVSELRAFLEVRLVSSTFVDGLGVYHLGPALPGNLASMLDINLDLSFPAMPCAVLSVDYQDIMGSHNMDVANSLVKTRIDSDGKALGSSPFSLSKEEVVRQAGEGCRIKGTLVVKNVPGNFHVSAHSRREFLTQLFPQSKMNVSHVIHHLSFGPQMDVKEQDKTTSFYPLNGHREIIDLEESSDTLPSFEYYIKMVPTILETLKGELSRSFQFTANSNAVHYNFPAVYFRFDMSPITVGFSACRWAYGLLSRSSTPKKECPFLILLFSSVRLLEAS